jgi:hypothetical protein
MKQQAQKILDYLQKLVKPKNKGDEYFNIYHPDFSESIEPAFKANGKQFYRFIKDTSIPWGRYMYLQTFLYEQSLRMDLDTLRGYISNMKYAVNGTVAKGIDLISVIRTLTQMESRTELGFETDTTFRLASVMYFDDQEDLYTYDKKHNDLKIAAWKEAKTLDFFYTRPMSELLGLSVLSPQDLQTFIEAQNKLLKELISETPAP